VRQGQPAELIIEGRIATLAGEEGFGWQAALSIGQGIVLGAGSAAEMEAMAGPRTERWRLPGDVLVMPGITDAHLHLMTMVLGADVDLSTASDLDETMDALARVHQATAEAVGRGRWLLGHGWSLDRLGGWPDAEMLKGVCAGRPVALYAHDHHSRWVSREALAAAGIDARTPDPDGGVVRRDADGEPTGILHETAAGLVDGAIPDPTEDELEAGLVRQAADLAALGITGCHDPGELTSERRIVRGPLFYGALAAHGQLPLRVHASIRASELDHAIELGLRSGGSIEPEGDEPHARRRAQRYRTGWLKLFADGALGSRSAAMLAPYSDAGVRAPTGGPRGMFLASAEELREDLGRAATAGISGQVHAIGDAAVRMVLDVFAEVPAGPLAKRVEHAQLVDPADQPRFGQLGVAASVQPVHLRTDAAPAREAWGERGENAFPLGALVGGGATIPLGTDGPVEPVDPWPGLAVAVARRDPFRPDDPPLGRGHAIGLARAIRAACLDPAQVAGLRDVGRLLPGYRADLLVVPAEGMREPVDPAALASTRPLATMIDGEIVFRAPDFEP
jgi:predicted amidohydrolase YtcJ